MTIGSKVKDKERDFYDAVESDVTDKNSKNLITSENEANGRETANGLCENRKDVKILVSLRNDIRGISTNESSINDIESPFSLNVDTREINLNEVFKAGTTQSIEFCGICGTYMLRRRDRKSVV